MSDPAKSNLAVVIGSGFRGIAAAIRLQARGYQVSICWKCATNPAVGPTFTGRTDLRFDAGPTIVTAPFLIDELFALGGQRTRKITFGSCRATRIYRIVFHDGRTFDYTGDEARNHRANPPFQPG